MTRLQKLDLLVKIMTVFNNSLLFLSFVVAGMTGHIGLVCSLSVYLFIGTILAFYYKKSQNFLMTLTLWLPAMSFQKVTEWISK